MFHGIPSRGGPEWSHGAHAPRAAARAATFDAAISRSGELQVTTDDGDTVSISFAALEQLHAESFRGKTQGARAAYGSTTETSEVSLNVSVEGSLDENEAADIGQLLEQLSAAIHDPEAAPDAAQLDNGGALDSLSAFQFAYQEQASAAYSYARLRYTA